MVKNLKSPMGLVIVSVALTLIVAFIGVIVMEIDKVTEEKAVSVEVNSKEIDANVQLETEVKEAKTYATSIAYPVTNIKDIDQVINNWTKDQESKFQQLIESLETKEDHTSGLHHLDIEATLYKVNQHLYSVLFTGKQQLKDEQVIHFTEIFTFDLNNEKTLSLSDVFEINDSFIEEIIRTAALLENEPAVDANLLKEALTDDNKQEWLMQQEEVSLFFNDKEIGDYEGNIEVTIPFVKIHDAIKDHYYNAMITEEMQLEIDHQPRQLDPNGKYVALTFDDGPEEKVTPRVLDTLSEFGVKATFYMLGKNAHAHPEIAKRVADEGHEVANHSITHANLNTLSTDKIIEEITLSQQQIEDATGIRTETFRPPYGEYNHLVLEQAKMTDQIISMWTIDTLDWSNRSPSAILEKVKRTTPGDIILMHDIHETTADALPVVLNYLQQEGFEFVTVMELIQLEDDFIEVGPYYGHNVSEEQAF